ncbi:unnamed protein product [Brassicogethes aeneus]|uniref:Chemosensory protein n=1 Tax=Brassicogethes aeneus TaxID=1431903 RepID=A0A9P0B887_BRAAE|nr:unnamed protein product [Brassicogethes aeneus]
MKYLVAVAVVVCFAQVYSQMPEAEKEKTLACALHKGPCTKEEQEIKDDVKLLLDNHCEKCTKEQIHMIEEFLEYVIARPSDWDELVKIYKLTKEQKEHLEDIADRGHEAAHEHLH